MQGISLDLYWVLCYLYDVALYSYWYLLTYYTWSSGVICQSSLGTVVEGEILLASSLIPIALAPVVIPKKRTVSIDHVAKAKAHASHNTIAIGLFM